MGLFESTHLPVPSAFYLIPSTLKEESYAEPSKLIPCLPCTGHGDLFSNCAFKLLPKVSNAPIPANNRPSAHILNAEATTKTPFRGCLSLKFQASLTFLKSSSYAAFEKRPPCPSFNRLIMRGEGMGLFERAHLPDQSSFGLYCGPSRGLHGNDLMDSITFFSGRPVRKSAGKQREGLDDLLFYLFVESKNFSSCFS